MQDETLIMYVLEFGATIIRDFMVCYYMLSVQYSNTNGQKHPQPDTAIYCNYHNPWLYINVLFTFLVLFYVPCHYLQAHYSDVIMGAFASQITSLTIVYTTVYSGTDQRKQQSSASLAFVWEIHRWPVNSQHKRPVTREMFPFDDIIMNPHILSTGP